MVAYEAKFHALSSYALQLINLEEDKIRHFVKGMNFGDQMVFSSVAASCKYFRMYYNLLRSLNHCEIKRSECRKGETSNLKLI